MEIEVLGSGSSGNCYKIKSGDTTFLIECGLPYKKIQKKLNFKISEIDFCLISHNHLDHAKSAKDLVKAGVDCYMTKGTSEALDLKSHRVKHFLKTGMGVYGWVYIDDIAIKPMKSIHDAKEGVNFFIRSLKEDETLMFVTDTAYMEYRIPDVDYLMIECNYIKRILDENGEIGILNTSLRNRIVKNHMSLETVLEALKEANLKKCKKIYALHLSDNNSDMYEIKRELQKATGCEVWI